MSAFISVSLSLMCLLICACTAQTNISAERGQNMVILPCKDPNINISNIRAVKWIRPDQDPEYVLFYRDGHIDPDNQHESYQNRVDLQDMEMKDGNFSMILKNVKMEDTGRYECRVFEKGKIDPVNNITLEVHLSVQEITPEVGVDVILPCKHPNNNKTVTNVEWIRPDQDPEYVLFYRDGRLDPDHQHPSYQNRVDLQDKDMKDGDASLVLKNVKMEDTGRYECRVFEIGKIELISIINLEVLPPGKSDESTRDAGDKTGIIVGSVVGVILLAVLASVGFLIYRRCRRQNQHRPVPLAEPRTTEMRPVPETRAEPPTASRTLREPTAEEEEPPTDSVPLTEPTAEEEPPEM